jgi:hypothetical protein
MGDLTIFRKSLSRGLTGGWAPVFRKAGIVGVVAMVVPTRRADSSGTPTRVLTA